MKNTIIILFICCISFIANTQKSKGYYNKDFIVSFESLVYNPVFYNSFQDYSGNSIYNKKLEKKKDIINVGLRFTAGLILKNNLAISCEYGVDFTDIYISNSPHFYLEPDYNEVWINKIQIQKIAVRGYTIMPKIEFSSKTSLMPMGFTHQLGFGITQSHIVKKDYSFDASGIVTNDTTGTINHEYIKDHLFNYDVHPIKTYTILYGFNVKNPISKFLFFSYGFRYTLNVKSLFNTFFYSRRYTSDFIYANGKIDAMIQNQRFLNFINFNAGFTYVF